MVIDLMLLHRGLRYGIEVKHHEAPTAPRSMRTAITDLGLDRLWILHPGEHAYPIDDRIEAWPLARVDELGQRFRAS